MQTPTYSVKHQTCSTPRLPRQSKNASQHQRLSNDRVITRVSRSHDLQPTITQIKYDAAKHYISIIFNVGVLGSSGIRTYRVETMCLLRSARLNNVVPDKYLDEWQLVNTRLYKLGCSRAIDNGIGWDIVELSSNFKKVCYIHQIHTFGRSWSLQHVTSCVKDTQRISSVG